MENIEKKPKIKQIKKRWRTHYTEALEYIEKTHTLPKKETLASTKISLGAWVAHQIIALKRGTLTPAKKKLIKHIEAAKRKHKSVWMKKSDQEWYEKYELFRAYVDKIGRLPTRSHEDVEERVFSRWKYRQKELCRAGELTKDKILKLEEISGWKWQN
ncbi:MAG: helicase associated domain-containing protein [Brevinema sp.]